MDYIVDFKPYTNPNFDIDYLASIESKISNGTSITENEAEVFLQNVSYLVRYLINPQMDNYDLKCDLAQSIICDYFNRIGGKIIPCTTQETISEYVEGHNFSIVKLNVEGEEKPYLLDPTYIQFFKKDKCQYNNYFFYPLKNPDRVLLTPNPGYFIQEEDKDAAGFLLKYGYIELTKEYARMYGDSFYNTRTGVDARDLSFQSISGNIYINSFEKGNAQLSKSPEELSQMNKRFTSFNQMRKNSIKTG